jgi:hypothetical protein
MFRLHSTTRLIVAALALLLLPAVPRLPALATLGLLAALVVGLNVWEQIRINRRGMN